MTASGEGALYQGIRATSCALEACAHDEFEALRAIERAAVLLKAIACCSSCEGRVDESAAFRGRPPSAHDTGIFEEAAV